jgi:hypothetical protein
VLRAANYLDEPEELAFGELHVCMGPDSVITVRHSEAPDLRHVRSRLQDDPELLARGPEAVLYAILDAVVAGYAPVVAGLDKDIDEIETEVFLGDPRVSRRIYELSREVVEFQRATRPLRIVLDALSAGSAKSAAILFAPTVIGTVYGMNFDLTPELRWGPGLPLRAHAHGDDERDAVRRVPAPKLDLRPSGDAAPATRSIRPRAARSLGDRAPSASRIPARSPETAIRAGARGTGGSPRAVRCAGRSVETAPATSTPYAGSAGAGNGGRSTNRAIRRAAGPPASTPSYEESCSSRSARLRGGSARPSSSAARAHSRTYASGPPGIGPPHVWWVVRKESVKATCTQRRRSGSLAV